MYQIGTTVCVTAKAHSALIGRIAVVEIVEKPNRRGKHPGWHYFVGLRFPDTIHGERLLWFRDDEVKRAKSETGEPSSEARDFLARAESNSHFRDMVRRLNDE